MTAIQEKKIKNYLKNYPSSIKSGIARGTGISLSTVCHVVDVLEAKKEVIVERVTKTVHLVTLHKNEQ